MDGVSFIYQQAGALGTHSSIGLVSSRCDQEPPHPRTANREPFAPLPLQEPHHREDANGLFALLYGFLAARSGLASSPDTLR